MPAQIRQVITTVIPSAIRAVHTRMIEKNITVKEQLSLSAHTTFRIGGPAALAVFPENAEQVCTVLMTCREYSVPCALIGNGSNLLCPDEGFAGCVLFTTAMKDITVKDTVITAGAGAALASICCTARDRGLTGLAFAYGIPGTLGGAIFMNAGAYGGEIGDCILDVTYLDTRTGKLQTISGTECGFSYRTSRFAEHRDILLSAHLSTEYGDTGTIRAEMEDISARRREKQPLESPSAGSAFKRYPGRFTAQLIDEAGLKGFSVGGAQVSEKHAGFIINRGGATASDVLSLMEQIQERIYALHSIRIEPEIRTLADCILP